MIGIDVRDTDLRFADGSTDAVATAAFVELKDMATGHVLSNLLGESYPVIGAELYRATDTLQSHTRTIVAILDDDIAGHISLIPAGEFAARAKASMLLLGRGRHHIRWRLGMDGLRRRLYGTVLGPWAQNQTYIESLAVFPGHRRHAIATRLIDHARSRCDAGQALSLNARSDNMPAVALYKKNGFVVAQRRGKFQRLVSVPEAGA